LNSIVEVVEHLVLSYSIPLQLTAIFTSKTMAEYERLHRFLLLIHLTQQEVKASWVTWRKSGLREGTRDATTRRRCDLTLHAAMRFLDGFRETFTSKILVADWSELLLCVDTTKSISHLQARHNQFVNDTLSCCFLQVDQTEVSRRFTKRLITTVVLHTRVLMPTEAPYSPHHLGTCMGVGAIDSGCYHAKQLP
jgi:hypothetical protein